MLALSRRRGQSIIIGPPDQPIAVIEVVDIRGDTVKLGIRADRSVPIHREEIAEEINAEALASKGAA